MNKWALLFGVVFGMLVTLAGFTQYDVIHQGLMFHSARIFLIMGSSIAVSMLTLWVLERRGWTTPLGGPLRFKRLGIERKHIFGGIVFGIGWAVSGRCPAVSAAMFGSGKLMGLIVMAGLFTGTLLRDVVVDSMTRQAVSQPSGHDVQDML
ncbi:MAG: YeeE/YedE family protein [Alicyclobacillus sp.]|nr:YeeE/YedE family protein [Alicyclobacillus sp.]